MSCQAFSQENSALCQHCTRPFKKEFSFFLITSIQPIHTFSEAAGSRYDLELCYTEDITGDDTESILLKMHCCIIS